MHLYKERPDGYFYFRLEFNKKRYIRSTKTKDKKAAQKVMQAFRDALVLNQHTSAAAIKEVTLEKAMAMFSSSKSDLKSHVSFKSHADFIVSKLPKSKNMKDLCTEDIESIVTARKKQSSPATALHTLNFIRGTWKHVKRLKYVVQEIEWPTVSVNNRRVRWLSDDEEKAFLGALDPHRTWTKMPKQMTAYQLEGLQRCWDVGIALLDTGARLSEIVYLKWNQVDLKNDQIDLERGKTNSNSLIGITKRFKQVLVRRLASKNGDYVFGKAEDGTPCKTVGTRIRNAIKRAGLKNFRLHDVRHTHATKLVRNGVSLYEISQVLGHTRVETSSRYSHLCNTSIASKSASVLDTLEEEKEGDG